MMFIAAQMDSIIARNIHGTPGIFRAMMESI